MSFREYLQEANEPVTPESMAAHLQKGRPKSWVSIEDDDQGVIIKIEYRNHKKDQTVEAKWILDVDGTAKDAYNGIDTIWAKEPNINLKSLTKFKKYMNDKFAAMKKALPRASAY